MKRSSVTFRVPASTSNLGSGFDTLGMALGIYNRVTVTRGIDPDTQTRDPFCQSVGEAFFQKTGRPAEPFDVHVEGDVPRSRGLGSSVTVRSGIFAGLNALWNTGLSPTDMAREVTRLEGHPDNAVASIFGGLTIAKTSGGATHLENYLRFPLSPELCFTVVSPQLEVKTKASRDLLPETLPFGEVVQSINSFGFFLAAMVSGQIEKLAEVQTEEFIHQPYRLSGIPGAREALDGARQAGAFGSWLSGSGSSLVAMSSRSNASPVKEALLTPFTNGQIPFQEFVLSADNDGMRPVIGV